MKKKLIYLPLLSLFFVILSGFFLPTLLKVQVIDKTGNEQRGATVQLYENESDYNNQENAIVEVVTNTRGRATMSKLQPMVYYIRVVLDDKSNETTGITTGRLVKGMLNKATIVIE